VTGQLHPLIEHIGQRITYSLHDADLSLTTPLVVAYSGGVDSSVLLQAIVDLREVHDFPIHAVHVHHGLSDNADHWARHCELQCRLNDVTFHLHHVNVDLSARKSLEAEARKARYQVLLGVCQEVGGALLLGQHAEDQLETVLLQLKRGAGPQGLSGMGEAQHREGVLVLRPMLAVEKSEIIQFARQYPIQWVEDESNSLNSFDRNFLRNEIIPQLTARWPKLTKTVGRSAQLCAEQTEQINDSARSYLREIERNSEQLNGQKLNALSASWRAAVIRAWFVAHRQLVPSKAQLDEILAMLDAKPDATPEVVFQWGKVARFQGDLHWVTPPIADAEPCMQLSANSDHELPWLNGSVHIALSGEKAHSKVVLRTNMRSLKVKPSTSAVSKPLKDWFKIWQVPRWERDGVPVIFVDDSPVALIVKDRCVYLQPQETSINISFTSHRN
jgi:tRNA(Ile)-lysidine synthase